MSLLVLFGSAGGSTPKGEGDVTELSLMGVFGPIHTFSAKPPHQANLLVAQMRQSSRGIFARVFGRVN